MSLLSQPLISYAEVTAELPCSKELWLCRTAEEWKITYLGRGEDMNKPLPSVRSCIDDSTHIFEDQGSVDVQMSLLLTIAVMWALVWQYREMKSAARSRSTGDQHKSTMTMSSRHQEILHMLQHTNLNATEWLGEMPPKTRLLHEQILMHLYVSLEDVQLLAGKDGEEETRRVIPILSSWAGSTDARKALFHAGQVIRAAKDFPPFTLRDSPAVGVYHASLVFWAWAVFSRKHERANVPSQSAGTTNLVVIDGGESAELQRFLVLGKGIPCIQGISEGSTPTTVIPLKHIAEVMKTINGTLQRHFNEDERTCPTLLENLTKLMQSLGRAASGTKGR